MTILQHKDHTLPHTLMQPEVNKVTIRVPATTANLGPGFDVLGLAMGIWMSVTVERASAFSMKISGEGASEIKGDESNLIVQSCALALKQHGISTLPPLKFTVESDIPFGCGCGSSSAAAVAGYMAGLRLANATLEAKEREVLLEVITELEGHPDNAAPAIYGGCRLGYKNKIGQTRTQHIPTPRGISLVLFVPNDKMKKNTHATRGLIPDKLAMVDAVHNMSRTAMIVLAFSTNQLESLSECLDERIHQKARARALFPHFDACVEGATSAGAEYAFLSGAGPTICAIVGGRKGELQLQQSSERRAERVAQSMVDAARRVGVAGRAIITIPTELGAHFLGGSVLNGGAIHYAKL
jgi:homoserine kinase